MDGIAVRARDTNGATETAPLGLKIGDQAVWVDTGDPMPDGYNAVIMVEHVHEIDSATVEIMAPVPPYHHIRALGEDIVATELLLPESHILRPVDVGACAAAGLTRVQVRRRPSVGVLPTGTELVAAGSALRPGEIVEFNSLMLAGLIDEWGGLATRHPPIPDDYERLKSAVLDLVRKHDIVVINAGSSAGSEDYTASLVEELGDLIVHGVAYRPGHPVVLGVADGKPVLGIPGYPVSAVLTCEIFVKPLIERKLGVRPKQRERIEAILSRKVASPIGEDEHLRVALGRVGERMIATPIQRGAGVITSLVRADGLVTVPRRSEGVEAGALVEVELLRHREEIERKIVATGSHDLTLDLLASRLRRTDPGLTLSSSNVGSLGGLMALSRREAHLAGTHLMDEETGEYNIPFVRKYLKGQEVVVVHLVGRVQGLMVTHGNPEDVSTLSDLAEDGMSFVNRQRGSGTRVLLDYKLKELGIEPAQIAGYEREEYTHLGVAAAVAGGRANTGLGILSAARAMGLEFVPLVNEQYDLVIPAEFYGGDLVKPLLDLIRSAEFRSEVEALGGYDASAMGEVVEGSDGD
jgi:putative molybdopterin biosynthesis protein